MPQIQPPSVGAFGEKVRLAFATLGSATRDDQYVWFSKPFLPIMTGARDLPFRDCGAHTDCLRSGGTPCSIFAIKAS